MAQSASKMLVTFALVDFGANSRLYPICCQLVPCGSKLAATDKCRLQFLEKILTLLLLLALPFFKRKFLRFHDANIGKEADVINQLKNDAVSCRCKWDFRSAADARNHDDHDGRSKN